MPRERAHWSNAPSLVGSWTRFDSTCGGYLLFTRSRLHSSRIAHRSGASQGRKAHLSLVGLLGRVLADQVAPLTARLARVLRRPSQYEYSTIEYSIIETKGGRANRISIRRRTRQRVYTTYAAYRIYCTSIYCSQPIYSSTNVHTSGSKFNCYRMPTYSYKIQRN